jgi:hypothetical protein
VQTRLIIAIEFERSLVQQDIDPLTRGHGSAWLGMIHGFAAHAGTRRRSISAIFADIRKGP